MIVGGITTSSSSRKARKTYLWMVQNIQLMGFVPKMTWIDNLVIRFIEEDARHLYHPYDDVLVVSIRVGEYNTHWVLVDNRSSADILYYSMFQQIRIESFKTWPKPRDYRLKGSMAALFQMRL